MVIFVSVAMYRPFLALCFNRRKAELLGMRPGRAQAAPATAALVMRTVPRMMAIAAALSVVSVWLGLLLSYHFRTAGSATMALVPIVAFS